MSINVSPIATTTQEDVTPATNYVWYKMYETSGATLSDDTGNADDITISGTLPGSVFDNSGYITPDGTTTFARGTLDAFVKTILRFDTMTNSQLLIAFDYFYDGDVTGNEQFFSFGKNSNSGYGLYVNSSDQFGWQTSGDTGGNENITFTGFALSAAHGNQRNNILCDIQGAGDGTASFDIYINSQLVVSSPANITLAGSGTGATSDTNNFGLTLMGNRVSATIVDRLISSAGGNARMGNFFAMQLAAIDTTLAAKVNKEFYDKQGDLPTILDNK